MGLVCHIVPNLQLLLRYKTVEWTRQSTMTLKNLQALRVGGDTEACKLPAHQGCWRCTAKSTENSLTYRRFGFTAHAKTAHGFTHDTQNSDYLLKHMNPTRSI